MESTTLSSKGQVIIPKAVRDELQWPPGAVFRVVVQDGGVLLTPAPLFAPTQPALAAGCLRRAPRGRPGRATGDATPALRRRALAEDRATKP